MACTGFGRVRVTPTRSRGFGSQRRGRVEAGDEHGARGVLVSFTVRRGEKVLREALYVCVFAGTFTSVTEKTSHHPRAGLGRLLWPQG